MKFIIPYNNALSFVSFWCNFKILSRNGPPVIVVHGITYHMSSTLATAPNSRAQYGQLYFLDSEEACQERKNQQKLPLKTAILREFDEFLRKNNPFAQTYMKMHELRKQSTVDARVIFLHTRRTDCGKDHSGTMEQPTTNEICSVFNEEGMSNRDIVVHLRGNANATQNVLQNIHIANPNREAMTYALLFPYGQQRWHVVMYSKSPRHGSKRITYREYICYDMSIRENVFNPIHFAGKLSQQYIIDTHICNEDNTLKYYLEAAN